MKWYVGLAMALLVVGVSLGHLGTQFGAQHVPLPSTSPVVSGDPDIQAHGVQFVEQEDTATAMALSAETAAWYDTTQFAIISQVHAQFFPSQAAPLSVEANSGRIARRTGDVDLQGRVRIQHQAGYTLTTAALHWRAAGRTLYTDAPIAMHSATVQITGIGLQGHIDQQRFRLQRDVRASFQLR